jgi:hypothetical protein
VKEENMKLRHTLKQSGIMVKEDHYYEDNYYKQHDNYSMALDIDYPSQDDHALSDTSSTVE